MSPEEFSIALKALDWKQSDFCRMAGVNKSTPSRWMTLDSPIPDWVPKFLGMGLEVKRLHDTYVLPPKAGKKSDA
ncbi:hypothetical protein [Paralcaligenes ureilyticus]|uniref:Uncharacterized protein n=1 Tax=Paralcaligenes ureilyticus TaxID=627131 RepID=A0A4R3M7K9_9BURK|nr:hypothetical protein [Paralcaligenes ureilyticus]TCT09471.1 hypothetical protein EDC26_10389 [Paralcaligenes ureilyticus]